MRLTRLIKPLFATWAAAEVLMDTGRDAVYSGKAGSVSGHLDPYRKNAVKASGAAVLSLAFGGLALLSFFQMGRHAKKHQQWKKTDAQLDADLADSLDASDAVAKY